MMHEGQVQTASRGRTAGEGNAEAAAAAMVTTASAGTAGPGRCHQRVQTGKGADAQPYQPRRGVQPLPVQWKARRSRCLTATAVRFWRASAGRRAGARRRERAGLVMAIACPPPAATDSGRASKAPTGAQTEPAVTAAGGWVGVRYGGESASGGSLSPVCPSSNLTSVTPLPQTLPSSPNPRPSSRVTAAVESDRLIPPVSTSFPARLNDCKLLQL